MKTLLGLLLILTVASAAPLQAAWVPIDISSSFNYDAFATQNEADNCNGGATGEISQHLGDHDLTSQVGEEAYGAGDVANGVAADGLYTGGNGEAYELGLGLARKYDAADGQTKIDNAYYEKFVSGGALSHTGTFNVATGQYDSINMLMTGNRYNEQAGRTFTATVEVQYVGDTNWYTVYSDIDTNELDGIKGGVFGGHFMDGPYSATFSAVDVGTRYTAEFGAATHFKTESGAEDIAMYEFATPLDTDETKILESIRMTATTDNNYRVNDFAVYAMSGDYAGPAILYTISSTLTGSGTATPAGDVEVALGGSTQIVYAADTGYEIVSFTENGVPDASAVGQANYAKDFLNVTTNISVDVEFVLHARDVPAQQTSAQIYGDGGVQGAAHLYAGTINTNPVSSVIAFQMPALEAGESILRADLVLDYYQAPGATIRHVDLYGVRTATSNTVVFDDHYAGPNDVTATKIKEDWVTAATPTGMVSEAVTTWLTNNYSAGDYVFFRISPDDTSEPWRLYRFKDENETTAPALRIWTDGSLFTISSILTGPGTATPAGDVAGAVKVAVGGTTQIVYAADAWHEIDAFTVDSVVESSAIGETNYTKVFSSVFDHIDVEAGFVVTVVSNVPATWYGPLGADPSQFDEDSDGLEFYVEYLLNTDPTVSNAFEITGHSIDGAGLPVVSWEGLDLPNGNVGTDYTLDLEGGSWSNLVGTATNVAGVTTWTGDDPVADPVEQFRLNLEYEEP